MEGMSYTKGIRHTEGEKGQKKSPLSEVTKYNDIKFSNQKADIGRMEI